MERAFQVKKGWKNKIQAVCHVDNSARVQSVYRNTNPKFYKLIEEYNKITNIPVLLNTSYNLNGEPIVCTPTDAIRTFFSCGLDVLVLGKYIIRKWNITGIIQKNMNSKVTVYIPNHNYEFYFKEAIESVINQTYKNWELILIIDGYNKISIEIGKKYVREYKNKIKLFINKNKIGLRGCANLALRKSKGVF